MKYKLTNILIIINLIITSCGQSQETSSMITPENQGILVDWYYVPAAGTIQGESRPYSPPVVSGKLTTDIIVMSDISGRIDYINKDGSIKWSTKENGTRLTDLQKIDNDHFSYGLRGKIVTAKTSTGEVISEVTPMPNEYVRNYRKVDDDKYLTMLHRNQSTNVFITDKDHNIIWQDTNISSYPRNADYLNGKIAVADTFGHKVYVTDLSDSLIVEFKEYFPNEVTFISETELLVTGEHRNRVFTYDITTGQKELLYGCTIGILADINTSHEDFLASDRTLLRKEPSNNKSKGICADDFANGGETLYSPNGARIHENGELMISDTDNHRVLVIKDGTVTAEITNFDNPISTIIIEQ